MSLAEVPHEHRNVVQIPASRDSGRPIPWPDMTGSGKPKPSYQNARLALELFPDLSFAHDAFADRSYIKSAGAEATLSDELVAHLRQRIVTAYGFDAGKDHCFDAALQLCREHPHDPVCEYLAQLTWDGRERLDHWLTDYLGADDTALARAFARKVLVAAVRRARRPGCKFDHILVLQGAQGVGKSSVVRILAGVSALFSDQDLLHGGTREQQELLAGVWLYEIGELAGMQRTEIEKIKAFASRTHDRARPAYGRLRIDQPRRCIFIATTNQDQFLRDHTGNRRFWPVRVGEINLDALAAIRDQLWAEAAALESTGEPLFLDAAMWSVAREAQDERLEEDPWLGVLSDLKINLSHDGSTERVAFASVMDALGIPPERQTPLVNRRVTEVMVRLGWERAPKPFKIGDKAVRGYTRAADKQAECNLEC